uniref:Uncharacterized protein n=1 Tax=Cannabis sativa TaxID=3483 RepID=A0A803QQW2_CANSA
MTATASRRRDHLAFIGHCGILLVNPDADGIRDFVLGFLKQYGDYNWVVKKKLEFTGETKSVERKEGL